MNATVTGTMTGGEAVVASLVAHGVDTVFGIPGTHNLSIFSAMPSLGVRNVTTRHEQGSGYAADGYARCSGRVGVVVTTTGPAALNAAAALAQANSDSIPILLIAPGMPTGHPSSGTGLLHEIRNQQLAFSGLVAESHRVESVSEISLAIAQAFARMRQGRPRSEYLEIPLDLLETSAKVAVVGPLPASRESHPEEVWLEHAATKLREAENVLLIVGGGARGASMQVRRLAEHLQSPVITTTNGKGVFDERHPLALGAGLQHRAALETVGGADVVLGVGTEFAPSDWWNGLPDFAEKLIRIDIDPTAILTNVVPAVPLLGEAVVVIEDLLNRSEPLNGVRDPWYENHRTALEAEREKQGEIWKVAMRSVDDALPNDAIIAADNAMAAYYGGLGLLRLSRPGAFMFPTGVGTLGYGLPAGIGAKIAYPGAPVIVIQGDGGMMFTVQELATAAQLELSLPIIVFDNGGYGEIYNEMDDRNDPVHSVALHSPNFGALAESLGCRGRVVEEHENLGEAVREALDEGRPTVLHVIEDGRAATRLRA